MRKLSSVYPWLYYITLGGFWHLFLCGIAIEESNTQKSNTDESNLENLIENANVPLCDFFQKWLKDRAISMGARVYANYAYDVKAYIAPYFRENPVSVLKVTSKELEAFYRFERQEDDATPEDLLQYHEAVTACLGYAEELGWIEENPAEEVNPCADQAPILFDEFIREWPEIIRSKIGEITYTSMWMPWAT